MLAIEINFNNLEKIEALTDLDRGNRSLIEIYLNHDRDQTWYLIDAFLNVYGQIVGYAILPQYIIKKRFDIDFEEAQTDWTLIYRSGSNAPLPHK